MLDEIHTRHLDIKQGHPTTHCEGMVPEAELEAMKNELEAQRERADNAVAQVAKAEAQLEVR